MSKGPSNNVRALVRFAHPALAHGCVVTDAKLRLHAGSAVGGRTLAGAARDRRLVRGRGHVEQPAGDRPARPRRSSSGTGYREWNVTAQVRAMYAAAPTTAS